VGKVERGKVVKAAEFSRGKLAHGVPAQVQAGQLIFESGKCAGLYTKGHLASGLKAQDFQALGS
jgi:hypothetical protein